MTGTLLRFYVHENRRHGHVLLYDWLLEEAKRLGIRGGSAFRAIGGFGRHGIRHAEHFFELAGDVAVEVELAVSDDEAGRMLARVRAEGVSVFYVRIPVEFGVITPESSKEE
jgi:PII-like signaling protein